MSDRHDELRESLGAYVLGQLDDVARHEVEEHLATCDECRAERDEIAPLAAALSAVDPADVRPVGITPPPELDHRILTSLPGPSSPLRVRRWAPAVGGAIIGIAASTIVAIAVIDNDPVQGPTIIAIDRVETSRGVTATAGLVDHTWGVELKLEVAGLPAGQTYDVWFIGRDGEKYAAGEFIGVKDKTITCDMSSAVLLDKARSFTVVDPDGREVIAGDVPGSAA